MNIDKRNEHVIKNHDKDLDEEYHPRPPFIQKESLIHFEEQKDVFKSPNASRIQSSGRLIP